MPRYFFDVRDGEGTLRDTEGMEFATLEDAILEAQTALHEMARDEPSVSNSAVAIDIREGDNSLATVLASTSVVPSLKGTRREGRSV